MAQVPAPWSDDGSTLSANGYIVVQGFREWMLTHNLSLGIPLTHAWDANDESHQIFTFGELGYNAKDGVFLCNVGANLVAGKFDSIPTTALTRKVIIAPTDPNKVKLGRVQSYLGQKTLGVYFGTWTVNFRATQLAPYFRAAKKRGFDYVMVKFGENGLMWYGGTEKEIQQAANDAGLGIVPYWYCRPNHWQADMANCATLANVFGGIDLDIEEVFVKIENKRIVGNYSAELAGIFNGIRSRAPQSIIIADGYGDPRTVFGTSFPYEAIRPADAYQPQWYESFYGARTWPQWLAGLTKHDAECGAEFTRVGLSTSFPIRPCVDSLDVPPDVAYQIGAWAKRFGASLMVWEWGLTNDAQVAAFKKGLNS